MDSFYSTKELMNLGLGEVGNNVLISKNAKLYCPQNIFLKDNVRIDDFCIISAGTKVCVGSYVHISAFVVLFGGSGIIVGDYCSISSFSAIYSESDDFSGKSLVNPWFPQKFKPGYKKGKVSLRNFSNVGAHSIIMPGVTLGEGSVVGSNSLVVSDCEEWSINAGTPSKKIEMRHYEISKMMDVFLNSNSGNEK